MESKLKINTLSAIINQLITIFCGFILPRFFLKYYGSQTYGLVSSISQFLGFVTLMELGMGAVVQSALYKPLAEKNEDEISKIIKSATVFFRKVAIIFLIYTIVLAIVYPIFIRKEFDFVFELSLILIISISSLSEYFFGITYKLLLFSDQKAYIPLFLQSIGLLLNFVVCIILMKVGCSIHIVKLISSLLLLVRPIVQIIYVNNKYNIDYNIVYEEEPIKQKWNGIAQHIAYYVTNNTDTIVLSFFSTLENVAIYSIYNLIVNGIKQMVLTLNAGIQPLFGNLLALNKIDELKMKFSEFEWRIHTIVTFLFSCVAVLIVPFISVYTSGINDAEYYQPLFALCLTFAQAAYCIRLPYNTMVNAAGHYKQTQISAIIEMVLNLSITIVLVFKYGLIGVAIGTLVALTYRTIYLACYLSRNIINYNFYHFIKNILVDILECCIILFLFSFVNNTCNNYLEWFYLSLKAVLISGMVIYVVNYFSYRKNLTSFINTVFKK